MAKLVEHGLSDGPVADKLHLGYNILYECLSAVNSGIDMPT